MDATTVFPYFDEANDEENTGNMDVGGSRRSVFWANLIYSVITPSWPTLPQEIHHQQRVHATTTEAQDYTKRQISINSLKLYENAFYT